MSSQQTLTGEPADDERQRPTTMLYCTKCDDYVLRSNQLDHPHDDLVEHTEDDYGGGGLPEDCRVNTKTYTVEFTVTGIEQVQVEASDKGEARRLADEVRSFDIEWMDDLHTEARSYDDYTQASTNYLERVGLLPTDWTENGGDGE